MQGVLVSWSFVQVMLDSCVGGRIKDLDLDG